MSAKSKLSRIEKRKRLDALFDRGIYVRFGVDDNGNPVVDPKDESDNDVRIWVGPPSPLQREMAVREAQAHRARTMIESRDDANSASAVTITNYVRGLSTESLLDYILDLEEAEFLTQARRDVLTRGEWDDFNSLRDAMRQYEEAGSPKDDPEWEPLLARDTKFGEQVLERALELKNDARAGYKLMPRAGLDDKAIDKRIEQAGSAAFMDSYEEWMLFYSCRDDEAHAELFFESREDLRSQPEEVQEALARTLGRFIAESGEAKN